MPEQPDGPVSEGFGGGPDDDVPGVAVPGDDAAGGGAGLVPPMSVMRQRLGRIHRADGFAGPTRRYVLLVALLVALASLPTLGAITAGTVAMDADEGGAMDVPFLPPPSAPCSRMSSTRLSGRPR